MSDCSCGHCHSGSFRVLAKKSGPDQKDPTRTETIRNQFAAAMAGRFIQVRKRIIEEVVKNDALNLEGTPTGIFTSPKRFDFPTSEQKVEEFMKWLREMVEKEVLFAFRGDPRYSAYKRWTDLWIESAYKRGIARALQLVGRTEEPLSADRPTGSALGLGPIHADRLGLLYTRTYNELEGVTDAMDQGISRVLAQGMAEGKSARVIARELNKQVEDIGIRRARLIARTEIIRAHHVAMVNSFREAGVEGVVVYAEWMTAQDDRVCNRCAPLEGKIFTLDEIEPMIPLHPACRCGIRPAKISPA